jgi:hypothetical protein
MLRLRFRPSVVRARLRVWGTGRLNFLFQPVQGVNTGHSSSLAYQPDVSGFQGAGQPFLHCLAGELHVVHKVLVTRFHRIPTFQGAGEDIPHYPDNAAFLLSHHLEEKTGRDGKGGGLLEAFEF